MVKGTQSRYVVRSISPAIVLCIVTTANADTGPSPSALFANRLMHYCCEEVEAAMGGSLAADSGEPDSSDFRCDPTNTDT